jgi:predicted O-methyltransferase YrrM/broad specificity phosphatase PhoE
MTEHGKAGCQLVAFTSPFQRCFQTAVGALGSVSCPSALAVDHGLCEHLRPDWFDATTAARPDFFLTSEALSAAHPGATTAAHATALAPASYPEGDDELFQRAQRVAASLIDLACSVEAPAAVLLVLHGGVLATVLRALSISCGSAAPAVPHQGFAAVSTVCLVPQGNKAPTLEVIGLCELPLRLTPHQRWFASQEPVWRDILLPRLALRKAQGAVSVLELGSWEGASAAWLLANACDGPAGSRLTCVDHFDKLRTPAGAQRAEKFGHNTRLTGLWPRVDLIVDFTVAALSRLLAERREWDLVYVDASHEACDTLLDAMLAWKGLRQGGILVFDDYLWPDHPKDSPLHPKPGIDAFLSLHAHELEVLHTGYQVMVVKLVPPRFNF